MIQSCWWPSHGHHEAGVSLCEDEFKLMKQTTGLVFYDHGRTVSEHIRDLNRVLIVGISAAGSIKISQR